MPLSRVSPDEALELMRNQGYVYVDVRSIPEFEAGHPEGAYNVPLLHMGPMGMTPNPAFLEVMKANFPQDTKLVLGCKAGGRSLNAATQLQAAGYQNVVDQRAGYDGQGEPGWRLRGLPVSQAAAPGRRYEELQGKLG
jgi:rhodanese-related sulfurtransferase